MPLIAYWPLSEESGSTAYDYSGNEIHGTITGAGPAGTGTTAGVTGNTAYTFDGNDDKVDFGSNFDFPDISVCAWVRISSSVSDTDERTMLVIDQSGVHPNFGIASGTLYFNATGASRIDTSADIKDGNWHHVVWTYDGTNFKIYSDGELVKEATRSYDSVSNGLLEIARAYGGWWNGEISELRIYDHALSSSEVQYLYSVGKKGTFVSNKRTL